MQWTDLFTQQYETVLDGENSGSLQQLAYHTVNRRYREFLNLQTRLEEKSDLRKFIKSQEFPQSWNTCLLFTSSHLDLRGWWPVGLWEGGRQRMQLQGPLLPPRIPSLHSGDSCLVLGSHGHTVPEGLFCHWMLHSGVPFSLSWRKKLSHFPLCLWHSLRSSITFYMFIDYLLLNIKILPRNPCQLSLTTRLCKYTVRHRDSKKME